MMTGLSIEVLFLTLSVTITASGDHSRDDPNHDLNDTLNVPKQQNLSNDSVVWVPVSRLKLNEVLKGLSNIAVSYGNQQINSKDNAPVIKIPDFISWPIDLLLQLAKALPGSIRNNLPSVQCYEDLGCFSQNDYLYVLNRPLGIMPMSPQDIDMKFNLFTCDNRYRPVVLDYKPDNETIKKSSFDPKRKTKFIIHGFRDYYDDMYWMGDMKDYILRQSCNYNVFCLDWSKGSRLTNYLLAVANTKIVGAMIAHFIARLKTVTNASPKDMELIGHSLGAHIAGYAGARFDEPRIAKILGLDPAGPGFQTERAEFRLDRSDADLVVIVHTDAGTLMSEGFGIEGSLGHIDIFPNNGVKQIGCELTRGVSNFLLKGAEGIVDTVNCNHRRATVLPIAEPSLFNTCQLIGYECESYDKFSEGECAHCGANEEKCKPLNLDLNYWDNYGDIKIGSKLDESKSRQLFIQTSDMFPFCLFHYQIVVYTAENSSVSTGSITVSLFGEKRDKLDVKLSQMVYRFRPQERYTYLLTYPKDLGLVMRAEIFWSFTGIDQFNPSFMLKRPAIKIRRIDVNFMSNSDPRIRNNFSSKLCPVISREILDGGSALFQTCSPSDKEDAETSEQ